MTRQIQMEELVESVLVEQLKDQIAMMYAIGSGIIGALSLVIGVLWSKINKLSDRLIAKDEELKKEYKENMSLFYEFKALLDAMVKGVETNLPNQINELKQNMSDRIKELRCKA